MSDNQTGHIFLSESLSKQAKKSHIFDGLYSTSLISLVQICDNECVEIFDKNEINILKASKLILKGRLNRFDGIWYIPIKNPI